MKLNTVALSLWALISCPNSVPVVTAQNTMVKMCLFYKNPSGHARSDPIINQQCASGHVHTVSFQHIYSLASCNHWERLDLFRCHSFLIAKKYCLLCVHSSMDPKTFIRKLLMKIFAILQVGLVPLPTSRISRFIGYV